MVHKKIREIRKSKGITAKFVAGKINKSPSWVSEVECGKIKLPADMLKPIADAIGEPVSSFFE